jgi:hypothetical protein
MKKLLGIVVLGLLLSGNAYAKILTLNCDNAYNVIEKEEIKIDTKKKELTTFTVHTDEFVKNASPGPLPNIQFLEYKLIYFNGNYAIGERSFMYGNEKRRSNLNVDLNKANYQIFFFFGDGSKGSTKVRQCKK